MSIIYYIMIKRNGHLTLYHLGLYRQQTMRHETLYQTSKRVAAVVIDIVMRYDDRPYHVVLGSLGRISQDLYIGYIHKLVSFMCWLFMCVSYCFSRNLLLLSVGYSCCHNYRFRVQSLIYRVYLPCPYYLPCM